MQALTKNDRTFSPSSATRAKLRSKQKLQPALRNCNNVFIL